MVVLRRSRSFPERLTIEIHIFLNIIILVKTHTKGGNDHDKERVYQRNRIPDETDR